MSEDLHEYGTVVSTGDGLATVRITPAGDCGECSARLLCRSEGTGERTVTVRDPLGVSDGDQVVFRVRAASVLHATVLLYGVPLAIVVGVLLIGMHWWQPFAIAPEAWSAGLAAAALAIWYGVLLLRGQGGRSDDSHLAVIEYIVPPGQAPFPSESST